MSLYFGGGSLHVTGMEQVPKRRVLVVDDEANAREALASILADEGYEVSQAADGQLALTAIDTFAPEVVLCDVRMPNLDGLSLLKKTREQEGAPLFVMMTAFGRIDAAVEAMVAGAENYLVKPLEVDAVLIVLKRAMEKAALIRETSLLKSRLHERFRVGNIVGDSPELQSVFDVVKRAAPTKATVLILGESGTGKELIAQAIH